MNVTTRTMARTQILHPFNRLGDPPAQTEVADNSVAQRVDLRLSPAYLQPLILSSSGAPQASSVAEQSLSITRQNQPR